MQRPTVLLVAAALAAVTAFHTTPAAEAGRRGDSLSGAAKAIRKAFKRDAKAADAAFAEVVSGLTKGLSNGSTSAEDAARGFGNALSFYAASVHKAANEASVDFAGEAVLEMSAQGDTTLPGAAAGDGGSFDTFAENMRSDLAKLRKKARKRATKFQNAFAKSDEQRGGMKVVFEDWTFARRPAPDVGGAANTLDEPLRMWGAVATRLTNGEIVVSAFGPAAPDRDNTFDVRLARGFNVRPLGDYVNDGGMDVNADGWWTFTDVVNNPYGGDTIEAGNAQIHFGVDPDDTQYSSRQEHGGIIAIP
jgi:hypothetical protein